MYAVGLGLTVGDRNSPITVAYQETWVQIMEGSSPGMVGGVPGPGSAQGPCCSQFPTALCQVEPTLMVQEEHT
jgi:hypothetical protein